MKRTCSMFPKGSDKHSEINYIKIGCFVLEGMHFHEDAQPRRRMAYMFTSSKVPLPLQNRVKVGSVWEPKKQVRQCRGEEAGQIVLSRRKNEADRPAQIGR